MNGIHDMGGMMGFGPIAPEPDEPVFHSWWEARVFALSQAAGPAMAWSIDEDRHACENHAPADYLALPYYGKWLAMMERLFVKYGAIGADELATGRAARKPAVAPAALSPAEAVAACFERHPYQRPARPPARFAVGDRVLTKTINPAGHTRLARYLRHHQGEVIAVNGAHVFPDANAHGLGENPQWLYTVRFSARELWGAEADPRDSIAADLWEPYLDVL